MHSAVYYPLGGLIQGRHASRACAPVPCLSYIGMRYVSNTCTIPLVGYCRGAFISLIYMHTCICNLDCFGSQYLCMHLAGPANSTHNSNSITYIILKNIFCWNCLQFPSLRFILGSPQGKITYFLYLFSLTLLLSLDIDHIAEMVQRKWLITETNRMLYYHLSFPNKQLLGVCTPCFKGGWEMKF